MRIKPLTLEHGFFGLALALALLVRLLNLGALPLSDGEAGWALQSFELSQGRQTVFGPQPGYVALTSLIFSALGSSNFLARLWPALAGAAVCLAPFFFRKALGRPAALLMAFGLALDPGMVAASRQAGGPALALGAFALAFGLFYMRQDFWAAVFAGLALLGGPAIFSGVLGGGLALAVLAVLARRQPAPEMEEGEGADSGFDLRQGLVIAVGVILLLGTLFIRFPQGLGAWVASLPAYLQGWVASSGVPALRLLAVLFIYQPLPLIFGLIEVFAAWREGRRTGQALSIWFALSLLLALLYPGRQVTDLVWALLPLWALAALQMARIFLPEMEAARAEAESDGRRGGRWVVFAQAAGIFVLLTAFWLQLLGLGLSGLAQQGTGLRLAVMAGLLVLVGVVTWLVGLGWSWVAAKNGLVLGLCAALGLYTLSGMWGSSQVSFSSRQDLWQPAPATVDAGLLQQTVADLSEWATGNAQEIDLTVAVDSPALRWLLRNFPHASFIPQEQAQALSGSPSVVFTRQAQDQPALASAYRGQDFSWWAFPGWGSALPPDPLRWLVFRQAPLVEEQIILWARGDLFPGELPSAAVQPPQP